MSRLVIALVAVGVFAVYSSVFVVDETKLAIVLQVGEHKRTISEPGLYFQVPIAQQVQRMERRVIATDTSPGNYLTLDKKKLVADPVTRWRVEEPLQFYKAVRNEVAAARRLDDVVKSEMRREISSHNFGDIIGNARAPLMSAVTERVRNKALEDFGIYVVDVRIKRADLPREVQESVFQRMRAERDREAKRYRSEGAEAAAKIRAQTDKEVTIVLAKAYQEAEKLQGEGDGESTRIYADAYGKDPEFYSLIRSLQAYEKSVSADTELVLSTGSDFFRYLTKPKGGR